MSDVVPYQSEQITTLPPSYQENNSNLNNTTNRSFFRRATQVVSDLVSWGIAKNPFYGTECNTPSRQLLDRDTVAREAQVAITDSRIDSYLPSSHAQTALELEAYKYNNTVVGNYFSSKLAQIFSGIIGFELAIWGMVTASSPVSSIEVCYPSRNIMTSNVATDNALVPLVCEPLEGTVADYICNFSTVKNLVLLTAGIGFFALTSLVKHLTKDTIASDISIRKFTKENIDTIMIKHKKLRTVSKQSILHIDVNQICPLSHQKLKDIKNKVIYKDVIFCYDTLKDRMENDPLGTEINGEGILNLKLTNVFRIPKANIRYIDRH